MVANIPVMTGLVKYATEGALLRDRILAIYFHKPSKTEFEWCIRWLKKRGFRFLSPHDIESVINKKMPFPHGAVMLTVDDGWQSNMTNVVEVANRHEVPVTIFVTTMPVEEGAFWWSHIQEANRLGLIPYSKKHLKKMPEELRLGILQDIKEKVVVAREAMTVEQVRSAAASPYITIGSHTHSHPVLVNCGEEQVFQELQRSRQLLELWTGKEVPYFAYPNGNYGPRETQILKTLNYRLAFCSQPQYLGPESLEDKFSLPRFGFLEGASAAENSCRITGIWQPLMQKMPHRILTRWKNKYLGINSINKLPYRRLPVPNIENSPDVV